MAAQSKESEAGSRKVKWQLEEVIGKHRAYARASRSEIIVRVELDGDTSKYAEWGMPKAFGLSAAMHQAVLQTNDEDIRP